MADVTARQILARRHGTTFDPNAMAAENGVALTGRIQTTAIRNSRRNASSVVPYARRG